MSLEQNGKYRRWISHFEEFLKDRKPTELYLLSHRTEKENANPKHNAEEELVEQALGPCVQGTEWSPGTLMIRLSFGNHGCASQKS